VLDHAFVVEVEVQVDSTGRLTSHRWLKGSGDSRLDGSVRQVLVQTKAVSRPPPSGFLEKFIIRFDVETSQ
jgi:TonB family protein